MNCAAFESALAELMAGEVAEVERDECIGALERHALGCAACAGTRDLLLVLAEPEATRDLYDPPDAAYWESFDDRLRARIAAEDARAGGGGARRLVVAAAAVALVGVLGWWMLRPQPGEPGDSMNASLGDAALTLPAEVEGLLASVAPDDAVEELAAFASAEDSWWIADEGAARGTVEDFEPYESFGGTAPLGDAGLLGETGVAGLAVEADGLDADARRELLDWLERQIAGSEGVS